MSLLHTSRRSLISDFQLLPATPHSILYIFFASSYSQPLLPQGLCTYGSLPHCLLFSFVSAISSLLLYVHLSGYLPGWLISHSDFPKRLVWLTPRSLLSVLVRTGTPGYFKDSSSSRGGLSLYQSPHYEKHTHTRPSQQGGKIYMYQHSGSYKKFSLEEGLW